MKKDNIIFNLCEWNEIHPFVERYIKVNNITVDSFWEDHVLESNHYIMRSGDETAGFFAIHGGQTVTLFHVYPLFANQAQALFARVKDYEYVTNAMVATGDEFFLSHCVDNFARIEKQAYFTIYTEREMPGERQKELSMRIADVEKDSEILKLSGDFLVDGIRKIKNGADGYFKIYIAEYEGEVVGFGVIEYGRVVKGIASNGMYVREEHRCKGFAANILRQLKQIVEDNGCKAFSGCWYYNHISKKSMESAGAYSKTRLLRFYF